MAGIPPPTPESLSALAASLSERADSPVGAVALLAEASAQELGATLVGAGLRLIDDHLRADRATAPIEYLAAAPTPRSALLGPVYEQLLAAVDRKVTGAHFTPPAVAHGLVDAVSDGWGCSDPPEILDPSCGGGAFLLAGAEMLVERWSLSRTEATQRIHGVDTDGGAVAVAEASLGLWCVEAGANCGPLDQLRVGDGLLEPLHPVDLVIGNPPFLNQLENRTVRSAEHRAVLRERYADRVGPYGDTAALFLLAGAEALRPGGRMMLIQPQSILSSRDTGDLRDWLIEAMDLLGLWFCDEQVFSAAVRVCAPIFGQPPIRAGIESSATEPTRARPDLRRWVGRDVSGASTRPSTQESLPTWGPLVADLVGIPSVHLDASATIGQIARVTAGFRDQFYGFADHTAETVDTPQPDKPAAVTVGMIDPLRLRWGTGAFKYAGTTWERPVVDLAAVRAVDPTLRGWADDRLVPKVLLATQTRVLEVVVDEAGVHLPITPVISIEPHGVGADTEPTADCGAWAASLPAGDQIWLLAAALMAPPITAWAGAHRLGTALAANAVKLAASDVAAVPLPVERSRWEEGARYAHAAQEASTPDDWRENLGALATAMTAAYGLAEDHPVVAWWHDRLPAWR